MYLDQKDFPMNNLSDSAKKKIEEASENFKLSDIPYPPLKNIFKAGYNAGYEVGRDEMKAEIDKWKDKYVEARSSGYAEGKEELQSQVQLLEDALNHYACSHYNHENFKCAHDDTATLALKKIRVIKWINGVKNGAT